MSIIQYDQNRRPVKTFVTTQQAALENGFDREEIFRAINSNTHFLRKRGYYFSRNTQPLVPDDEFALDDVVMADNFLYDRIHYQDIVGRIVQIYDNSVCLDISNADSIPNRIKYRLAGKIVVSKRSIKQVVMEG